MVTASEPAPSGSPAPGKGLAYQSKEDRQVWTTRPNLDAFNTLRGSQTQAAFAAELQLDQSTLSRALATDENGYAIGTAGPKLVAHALKLTPRDFSDLFVVVEVDSP